MWSLSAISNEIRARVTRLTGIAGVALASLRAQISVVAQEPFLFNGTIRENIAYGRPEATPEQVAEAARLANAHDFISALPETVKNIAVLERGAIGQGNSGRNTQVVRSDYYHLESSRFFNRSLTLYEGLSRELNFNVMLSQRGKVDLAHSPHAMETLRRSGKDLPFILHEESHALTTEGIANMLGAMPVILAKNDTPLDGKTVAMEYLKEAGVAIVDLDALKPRLSSADKARLRSSMRAVRSSRCCAITPRSASANCKRPCNAKGV